MTTTSEKTSTTPKRKILPPREEGSGTKLIKPRQTTTKGAMTAPTARAKTISVMKARKYRAHLRSAMIIDRVQIEREGVPSGVVKNLIHEIGYSSTDFLQIARIPKATFTKKMRTHGSFSGTQGLSVVGLMDLINKVEDMLAADPDNDTANFDVAKWVGDWIQRPQAALGGIAPAEILDTPTGRDSVMRLLGSIQSGSYQ